MQDSKDDWLIPVFCDKHECTGVKEFKSGGFSKLCSSKATTAHSAAASESNKPKQYEAVNDQIVFGAPNAANYEHVK